MKRIILTICLIALIALPASAASFKVTASASTVNVGAIVTFKANTSAKVYWISGSSRVAEIVSTTNNTCKVKAKNIGTASIIARSGSNRVITKLNVTAKTKKIKLNKTSLSLKDCYRYTLKATKTPSNSTDKIYWSSSNNKIATVKNGVVTVKNAGKVKITARSGGKTATCTIKTSYSPPKFINVNSCYSYLKNYRRNAGRRTVSRSTYLEKYAKARAKEVAKKNSHTRPNGRVGYTIIPKYWNYDVAENIASGHTSCKEVSTAWYKSASHRKALLGRTYRRAGIAGYRYKGCIYWVQLFTS